MNAITMAPMAYRPIVRVIRSSSITICVDCRGNRMLCSDRDRFGSSMTRNSVMNAIESAPRPKPKILPPTSKASPSFEGRSAASDSARACSSSPRLVRRSRSWNSSDARMRSTMLGRSSIRSRTAPTNGLTRRYPIKPSMTARPSTTRIAALPRFIPRRSSSQVTGVVSTIARKRAMKIQRTACRAAMKAQTTAIVPRIVTSVRVEIVISTRFGCGSGVATMRV